MSSKRPRRGKRSKTWDESTYDPSNQEDDEDEDMEDEYEREFEVDEELEEDEEDEDVEMTVPEVEIEETEEEVEIDDFSRHRHGQIETYEVDSIIQKKFENGREMFLVQWKGYTKPTWEPRENLDNCTEALDSFFSLIKDADFDSKSESDLKHEKWRSSIKEAYETSKKFDYEIYEKYILRRGLIEVGEGYKIENVPFANIASSASRQNSISSLKG
ncbi:hypothetical protein C1646_762773 [Rhizophagus diaphanus]|nr:hypothetical protein C1646_762773 [Rhizophagus diaphanus] [Rhizophagus sp. MUCL 43196]